METCLAAAQAEVLRSNERLNINTLAAHTNLTNATLPCGQGFTQLSVRPMWLVTQPW